MRGTLKFTKMHGLGNDFIVVDDYFARSFTPAAPSPAPGMKKGGEAELSRYSAGGVQPMPFAPAPLDAALARALCDRRFGIGADQILWLKPSQLTRPNAQGNSALSPLLDFRMDILNADGSVAEMCGNGIRAAALYFHARSAKAGAQAQNKGRYEIETLAGVIGADVCDGQVRVNMGVPRLARKAAEGETLEVSGTAYKFYRVNMGNPHVVIFTDAPVSDEKLAELGPMIEMHSQFAPERTNVEFVSIEGPQKIRVKVWERGAGVTLACGTGACASAVAAIATGRVSGDQPVTVLLPGGELRISWNGSQESAVFMEGPAQEVFCGEYEITT